MLPVEAIEYMIKKGAKIVYRDTEGLNAIHVAAIANRPDLLRLFVAKSLSST
jgi:ankyrin repeat protein